MKFEIDVDLPEDVLKEWEPVAFRVLRDDEAFVSSEGNVLTKYQSALRTTEPRLILRRRFVWPAWLKCRYLAWDADGTASGWNETPEMSSVDWHNDNDTANKLEFVASTQHATHFGVAFPGGDWRTRIEENPNWSKTDDARKD